MARNLIMLTEYTLPNAKKLITLLILIVLNFPFYWSTEHKIKWFTTLIPLNFMKIVLGINHYWFKALSKELRFSNKDIMNYKMMWKLNN